MRKLFIVCLLCIFPLAALYAGSASLVVVKVKGSVEVAKTDKDKWQPLTVNTALKSNYIIKCGENGFAELKHGKDIYKINPLTKVSISDILLEGENRRKLPEYVRQLFEEIRVRSTGDTYFAEDTDVLGTRADKAELKRGKDEKAIAEVDKRTSFEISKGTPSDMSVIESASKINYDEVSPASKPAEGAVAGEVVSDSIGIEVASIGFAGGGYKPELENQLDESRKANELGFVKSGDTVSAFPAESSIAMQPATSNAREKREAKEIEEKKVALKSKEAIVHADKLELARQRAEDIVVAKHSKAKKQEEVAAELLDYNGIVFLFDNKKYPSVIIRCGRFIASYLPSEKQDRVKLLLAKALLYEGMKDKAEVIIRELETSKIVKDELYLFKKEINKANER